MNKRLFFSISLVLVLCLASNASAGLVAWWNFDDSTADDAFLGAHHGTLEADAGANTVTFAWDTGPAGSAGLPMDSNVAVFPGDANTMINCGGGKTNPGDPCTWADILGDTITVAAWIKHDGLFFTSYEYAFAKEDMWRVSRWSSTRYMRVYFDDVGGTLTADSSTIADDGEWHHIAGVYDGITMKIYWDGDLSNTKAGGGNLNSTKTHNVTIGGHPGNSVRVWKGRIDSVRLYNSAEAWWRIRSWARNSKAFNPVPVDGALYQESSLAQVSWEGQPGTDDYRLYLGTNETLVTNGDASVDKGVIAGGGAGDYNSAPMGALAYDTAYYWRVDANEGGNMHGGDVWQFTTKPAWTEDPWPFVGCKYVPLAQQLSWKGGADSIKHEVFFSANEQWVIDACEGVHLATIVAPDPCVYSPTLAVDTTYYWKVDSNSGTLYSVGNVWSLSTDAPSPEAGLVGYYPMEEEYGSSSVTWDISGNMHHGTLVQGDAGTSIGIVVDGERGNVLKTDLTTAGLVNSALDLGGNADDVHDPCWGYVAQDQMTVMMWAKPEEFHGTDYIYTRGNNVQLTYTFSLTPGASGRIRYYSSTLADSTTYGVPGYDIGNWQHIALTYDRYGLEGEPNEKRIYFNGALLQSDVFTGTPGGTRTHQLMTHADSLVIGGRLNTGYNTRGYDGLLDDVKIYDIVVPCWKIVAEGTQCGTCVGDLDANSVVNLDDLNQLVGDLTAAKLATGWNQWLITENDPCSGDLWKNCSDMDADDDIDLADLNRMVGNLTWEELTGTPGWSYPAGTYCP